MIDVEQSVEIDRSVDAVFEFVSTAGNDPLWETGVEACVPDGEPGVGQHRDVEMRAFGRRYQGTAEMTEYDPPERLTIAIRSGLPVTGETTYEFTAVNGGTHLAMSMRVAPQSRLLRLAQPLMQPMMNRQWRDDLTTLRDLLEAETAPTRATT